MESDSAVKGHPVFHGRLIGICAVRLFFSDFVRRSIEIVYRFSVFVLRAHVVGLSARVLFGHVAAVVESLVYGVALVPLPAARFVVVRFGSFRREILLSRVRVG